MKKIYFTDYKKLTMKVEAKMTVQISIVGLGQIGTSIGLALADQTDTIRRTGHDKDLSIARKAQQLGAIDKIEFNLPNAIRDSDLVLLALPIDEIKETLSIIAQDLKENAVVLDTGAVKKVIAQWAEEILPEECFYVGLTPVINPAYLHDAQSGIDAAQKDLFKGGLMAIAAPPSTRAEAVKLAADLTRLLGAMPFFVDPEEMDGLMAATHWLPQFLAAALVHATIDQPGWLEGRKIAGRAYAEATGPIDHLGDAGALKSAAFYISDNIIRVINDVIASLMVIRTDIEQKDEEALQEYLQKAREGRQKWWIDRQRGEWLAEDLGVAQIPEKPGILERLLGIHSKKSRQ
jgi:prephenate dehydrogenase